MIIEPSEQPTINAEVVKANKAFLQRVLNEMHMDDLPVAIALEQLASEIRREQAAKWRLTQQH